MEEEYACSPNPCGPNSECIDNSGKAVCKCMPSFFGSPPYCRPECTVNSECPPHLACTNTKCSDPCTGTCGSNALCSVNNHIPICMCEDGYEGDPFTFCHLPVKILEQDRPTPCVPSPCGINAECTERNDAGSCRCRTGYYGNPYDICKPECSVNSDCPSNKACYNNKCSDPCPGTCGLNALCHVTNHNPLCTCPEQYYGNPYQSCLFKDIKSLNPCEPSPCGPNSRCKLQNELAICTCLDGYQGSPPFCKPECTADIDCRLDKMCEHNKCVSPCPKPCGENTVCRAINHKPMCSCDYGYTGNPFSQCYPIPGMFICSYHNVLLIYLFILGGRLFSFNNNIFSSRVKTIRYDTERSMYSITMRSQFSMHRHRRNRLLLLFTGAYWEPAILYTRMYNKHKL